MHRVLKLKIFLKIARVTIQSNSSSLSITKKLEAIGKSLIDINQAMQSKFTDLESKIVQKKPKKPIAPKINVPKVQNLPPLRDEEMQQRKADKLIELLGK